MKQRVKRRQERQEKCSSWKRSWEGRKSWMQGVGRRKRGETRGGGIGWLNQCTLPLQILSTLSLSLAPTNTPIHSDLICVSMKSDPLPFPLHYSNLHIQSLYMCVCMRLSQPFLPDIPQQMKDWLLGYRNRKKSEEYSLNLSTFETFFNFRTPSAPSVLFFFQTLGWNFCWETASFRRLCYWNIQFLLGFWTLIRD